MSSGGKDKSIDEIFLLTLDLLFFVEEICGELGLAYADDIGFSKQACAGVESSNTVIDDRFSVTHL